MQRLKILDMSEKGTDFNILKNGIKKMAVALPLMFLGPYVLTLSFLNKETYMFYIFLALGLAIAGSAIYLAFSGINTIMKSIFGEKKKKN